jgi:riboflavin kinase / FMN adenylyltransferase
MSRVVTWEPDSPSLPRSVVAIGVFDGVHLGHQAILAETVAEAGAHSAASVAITFDRDPDQVVTPETAAPQLLTLDDKLAFIGDCGIDTVLVVPFTAAIAALSPTTFLDSVVAPAVDVASVRVGSDFRFGAKAGGDLNTLRTWAESRGIVVTGQKLLTVDDAPVTSTRIRGLVAAGDIVAAAGLLGRAHRVTGTVVRGREVGRQLGFPTANLSPVPFAALPGDGVYAGRALLRDGSAWPAAISVGTPPTFPEARDHLEVHLISFEGDLYDSTLTLEFLARLRDQRAFADVTELSDAIRADVARAADIGR